MEGARMNGFIHTAEREMSSFRKHYEVCVLDRNGVGISLIDRNDELCILYEKSNVQVGCLVPCSIIKMPLKINMFYNKDGTKY